MPVIGTSGHVDHGKSTLVQALTGIDPDRLQEEKERGLTIDLGFAWLTLPSGLEVGIVDVPGHERFIKNMLAGAGGIDLALLVIAADEGPRQQTAEHLAILDLLEVPAGIVVITKCDLVEEDYLELVEAEVEEALKRSRMAGSPMVRVSATTGDGLDRLVAAIEKALAEMPAKRDLGAARIPIDRVFTVKGFGTVVTGTLLDGWLEVGDEVEIIPGGRRARVRGLQRHKAKVTALGPGTRAAVNLSGVHEEDLHRGMTLARPGRLSAATSIVVPLEASAILSHPLAHDSEVTLMCATAEGQARVRLLDADSLDPGSTVWAQVVLAGEMPAMPGDHVVVRTPNETVAGGRIVVVNGRRLRRNDAATLEQLQRRLAGTPETRILDALDGGPATADRLRHAVGIPALGFDDALAELKGKGEVSERRGLHYTHQWATRQGDRLLQVLAAYLEEHGLRASAPREHVRSATHLDAVSFDLLVEALAREDLVSVRGSGLAPPGFEPRLSSQQQAEVEAFLSALRATPYSPPTEEFPPQPLLAYLAERGEIEDTGAGVVFAADAFGEMTARLRAHIENHGSVSMAEVRDMFGNSRKYAQAFLEHLDALHITRRPGDARTLR